jgi:hypothetical protein
MFSIGTVRVVILSQNADDFTHLFPASPPGKERTTRGINKPVV